MEDLLGSKETAVIFGFETSSSVLLFSLVCCLVLAFSSSSQVTELVLCRRRQ